MRFRTVIVILALLLSGCAANMLPDSTELPVAESPSAPIKITSPLPEPSPSPEPVVTPEETVTQEPTFNTDDRYERYDSQMHSVFPEAERIPEIIHARYGASGEITADFDGDGMDDVFYYASEYLDTGDEHDNHPTRLTLTVNEALLVYDSTWNDGLLLFTADFDESDEYIDIGIVDTGTDISCRLHIFRYGGSDITEYDSIHYFFGDSLYTDSNGSIFYFSDGYVDLGNGDFDIDYDRYELPERYDYNLKAIVPRK